MSNFKALLIMPPFFCGWWGEAIIEVKNNGEMEFDFQRKFLKDSVWMAKVKIDLYI